MEEKGKRRKYEFIILNIIRYYNRKISGFRSIKMIPKLSMSSILH